MAHPDDGTSEALTMPTASLPSTCQVPKVAGPTLCTIARELRDEIFRYLMPSALRIKLVDGILEQDSSDEVSEEISSPTSSIQVLNWGEFEDYYNLSLTCTQFVEEVRANLHKGTVLAYDAEAAFEDPETERAPLSQQFLEKFSTIDVGVPHALFWRPTFARNPFKRYFELGYLSVRFTKKADAETFTLAGCHWQLFAHSRNKAKDDKVKLVDQKSIKEFQVQNEAITSARLRAAFGGVNANGHIDKDGQLETVAQLTPGNLKDIEDLMTFEIQEAGLHKDRSNALVWYHGDRAEVSEALEYACRYPKGGRRSMPGKTKPLQYEGTTDIDIVYELCLGDHYWVWPSFSDISGVHTHTPEEMVELNSRYEKEWRKVLLGPEDRNT